MNDAGGRMKRSRRAGRAGFTLTEILVVIVLILLLLGMAVPAFHLIKGNRSVDSAENQIAAMLGRARADAIGLQKPFGVIFFIDPNSFPPTGDPLEGRVVVAEVVATDSPPTAAAATREVYLERVSDADYLYLPSGVLAMTLNNTDVPPPIQPVDRYLGFNATLTSNGATVATQYQPPTGPGVPNWKLYIGGVILFGPDGQVVSKTWGYSAWNFNTLQQTAIAQELGLPGSAATPYFDAGPFPVPTGAMGGVPRTSLGVALFDQAAFKPNGNVTSMSPVEDPQMSNIAYGTTTELQEEQWIDDNSTPLLINRYNGTLIRGE